MRVSGEAVGCLDNLWTSRAYSLREGAPNPLVKKKRGQQDLEEILITLTTSRINAFGCLGNVGQKLISQIKVEDALLHIDPQ